MKQLSAYCVDTVINRKIHDNNAAMDEIKVVCLAYTHKVTSLYSGQDISSVMYFATKKKEEDSEVNTYC